MRAFYQGKVDNFCAVYAVLNALQILHDIRPFKARDIFNTVLLELGGDKERFAAVLNHQTDYVDLVDGMLRDLRAEYPLKVEAPLAAGTPKREVWRALTEYAVPEMRRTAVFRFTRYLPGRLAPLTDHWSTALRMENGGLRLFDSSLEEEGVYLLPEHAVAARPGLLNQEFFVIPPECVRLLSLP